MKETDAAKLLGLEGEITPEIVKAAYKRAAMKYHPDRNAGNEKVVENMMKAINAAYDVLKEFSGEVTRNGVDNYPDALEAALNAIVLCAGLDIEVCGAWVWVSGNTKPHKETLKGAHYRWAPKKRMWYFRPEDWKSASRGGTDIDDIRETYGSLKVATRSRPLLAAS